MAPIRSAFCTSGHGTCVSVYLSLCLFLFSPMLCLIHECQLCLSPTSQLVFLISDFDGVLVHTHMFLCIRPAGATWRMPRSERALRCHLKYRDRVPLKILTRNRSRTNKFIIASSR